ncbi:MAG: thermonuclease family protein [Rickettsiales bacterium]
MLKKTIIFFIIYLSFSLKTFANDKIIANDNNHQAKIYNWQVLRVLDGDTLEINNEFLPQELKLFVRIKGIDTPEKSFRAKCLKEKKLAQKATDFTTKLINEAIANKQKIEFSEIKWDKYGGRIVAKVKIGDKIIGDELIKNGLAKAYFGEKKSSWCN